jgi:hypothetical protein
MRLMPGFRASVALRSALTGNQVPDERRHSCVQFDFNELAVLIRPPPNRSGFH